MPNGTQVVGDVLYTSVVAEVTRWTGRTLLLILCTNSVAVCQLRAVNRAFSLRAVVAFWARFFDRITLMTPVSFRAWYTIIQVPCSHFLSYEVLGAWSRVSGAFQAVKTCRALSSTVVIRYTGGGDRIWYVVHGSVLL
jgi:hypothetical protein